VTQGLLFDLSDPRLLRYDAWVKIVHPKNGTLAVADCYYRIDGYPLQKVSYRCHNTHEAAIYAVRQLLCFAAVRQLAIVVHVCQKSVTANLDPQLLVRKQGSVLRWMCKAGVDAHLFSKMPTVTHYGVWRQEALA
jgi:hypothetical protein